MPIRLRTLVVVPVLLVVTAGAARAQVAASPQPAAAAKDEGWKVTVYPLLAWVPTSINIDVNLPPIDTGGGGSGGTGGSGSENGGKIVDPRFDGAFIGGVSASKDLLRVDADGLWAAVGGDRPERPVLRADVDVIYVHVSGGVKVYKGLYATAGVRRMALKYNIQLGDRPEFERKPGVWDPVIGIGWHGEYGKAFEVHAVAEGGGFGVGTDSEFFGSFRADWKPFTHFGFTGGYSLLTFKLSDTVASRTLVARQTLQGPVVGVGLYF